MEGIACWCTSEDCRLHGCQALRERQKWLTTGTIPYTSGQPCYVPYSDRRQEKTVVDEIIEAYERGKKAGLEEAKLSQSNV